MFPFTNHYFLYEELSVFVHLYARKEVTYCTFKLLFRLTLPRYKADGNSFYATGMYSNQ